MKPKGIKAPFGGRPLLLSFGEKESVFIDFMRSFSLEDEVTTEDAFNWVSNTAILWERFNWATEQRLNSIMSHGLFTPEMFKESYSWGLDFNPLHVLSCAFKDCISSCFQAKKGESKRLAYQEWQRRIDWYKVTDVVVTHFYQEWRLELPEDTRKTLPTVCSIRC